MRDRGWMRRVGFFIGAIPGWVRVAGEIWEGWETLLHMDVCVCAYDVDKEGSLPTLPGHTPPRED